jgi:hypothetical protein
MQKFQFYFKIYQQVILSAFLIRPAMAQVLLLWWLWIKR